MEKLFLENSKWQNMKDDIFQKIQDFIIAIPLNEMFLFFVML
jgi:hypothetical protein